jgi:hypothetical protein
MNIGRAKTPLVPACSNRKNLHFGWNEKGYCITICFGVENYLIAWFAFLNGYSGYVISNVEAANF